jgi:hypothetical protein
MEAVDEVEHKITEASGVYVAVSSCIKIIKGGSYDKNRHVKV